MLITIFVFHPYEHVLLDSFTSMNSSYFQILTFEAYFQQAAWEIRKIPYQIRKVKILFFLEDGTIQVNEPRVDNSGMTQGETG